MGITRFAVLTGLAAAALAAAPAHARAPDLNPDADRLFAAFNSINSAGCAVSVTQDGQPILEKAYGAADLEHDIPIGPTTVFEAGSVSKQFTAAAILLLVQDGKVRLGEDIRAYLPQMPDYGRPITVEQLLNHTSGLRDWGELAWFQGWPRGNRAYSQADVLDLIYRQRSLNYLPGAEYGYTNSGYNLLAEIVRKVSGQSLADFTAARIFTPLGMTSTAWRDDFRRIVKGRAIAYQRTLAGYQQQMPFEDGYGHGGLLTTVRDLQTWNKSLTTRRLGSFLSSELQRRGVLADGTKITYARGLVVGRFIGAEEVGHTGSTAGYRAWLGRYPAQKLSVAVLCNASDADPLAMGRGVVAGLLPPAPAQPQPIPLADATGRTGLYVSEKTGRPMMIVAGDGGNLRVAGGGTLWPLGADALRLGADEVAFDGRTSLTIKAFDGGRYLYRKTALWRPAVRSLAGFVGTYRNNEIGVTYRVILEGGQLSLRLDQRPQWRVKLTPIYQDAFTLEGNLARFRRDARGKITGLSLGSARVRDLRLAKIG